MATGNKRYTYISGSYAYSSESIGTYSYTPSFSMTSPAAPTVKGYAHSGAGSGSLSRRTTTEYTPISSGGWYRTKEATGTKYAPGVTIPGSDVGNVLYWKSTQTTYYEYRAYVTYRDNDGRELDIFTGSWTTTATTNFRFNDVTPTLDGYTLLGWSTTNYTIGTGTPEYDAGVTYYPIDWSANTNGITVYPVWEPIRTNNAHVKVDGVWKEGKVHVNVNGTWKEGTPYVNVNGVWKEGK